MKRLVSLAALLALLLTLAACSAAPRAEEASAEDSATLEELCGADYQDYIT